MARGAGRAARRRERGRRRHRGPRREPARDQAVDDLRDDGRRSDSASGEHRQGRRRHPSSSKPSRSRRWQDPVGYGIVHISAASDVRLGGAGRVGLGSIDMPNGSEDGYRRTRRTRMVRLTPRWSGTTSPSASATSRWTASPGSAAAEPFEPLEPRLRARASRRVGPGRWHAGWCRRAHQLADGTIYLPDGTVVLPRWQLGPRKRAKVLPTGEVVLETTRIARDGTVTLWSGIVIRPVPPGRSAGADDRAGRSQRRALRRRAPGGPHRPRPRARPPGPAVKRHLLDPISLVLGSW